MPQRLTDLIELAVGAVCLTAAIAAWRRGGTAFRLTGAILVVAGIAAIVHASISIAGD
jgi:hypothetical protein